MTTNTLGLFNKAADSIINKVGKERLLIAVSGGSDSLGLLLLASKVVAKENLFAAFVDHGLRTGVEEEWKHVSKICSDMGVLAFKLKIENAQKASKEGGIMEWARVGRYELLKASALKHKCSFIAVGHTIDDQAETMMLRLLRGTGVDGLQCIPSTRQLGDNVEIIRPLLDISRQDIRKWLEENGVSWCDDPSNKNDYFLRVKVRQTLIPQLKSMSPNISNHIFDLAKEFSALISFADKQLGELSDEVYQRLKLCDGIKVDSQIFQRFPFSIWPRIIRIAIKKATGDLRAFERIHFEEISKGLEKKGRGLKFLLPRGVCVFVVKGNLFVFSKGYPQIKKDDIVFKKQDDCLIFSSQTQDFWVKIENCQDYFTDMNSFLVRYRQKGDKIWGRNTSLGSYLIEKNIPVFYRDCIPLVVLETDKVISSPVKLKSNYSELQIKWHIGFKSPIWDLKIDLDT